MTGRFKTFLLIPDTLYNSVDNLKEMAEQSSFVSLDLSKSAITALWPALAVAGALSNLI